jgi:hypothetical protein
MTWVRFVGEIRSPFVLHRVQSGPVVNPGMHSVFTAGSLPRGNSAGAWRWQLNSILCRDQEGLTCASIPWLSSTPWAVRLPKLYRGVGYCLVDNKQQIEVSRGQKVRWAVVSTSGHVWRAGLSTFLATWPHCGEISNYSARSALNVII